MGSLGLLKFIWNVKSMIRCFQSQGNGKLGVVLGVLTHELETLKECFLPRHCSKIHDELL